MPKKRTGLLDNDPELEALRAEAARVDAELNKAMSASRGAINQANRVADMLAQPLGTIQRRSQPTPEINPEPTKQGFFAKILGGIKDFFKGVSKLFGGEKSTPTRYIEPPAASRTSSYGQIAGDLARKPAPIESLEASRLKLSQLTLAFKEKEFSRKDHAVRGSSAREKLSVIQSIEQKGGILEKIQALAANPEKSQKAAPLRQFLRDRSWVEATIKQHDERSPVTLREFSALYRSEQQTFSLSNDPTPDKLQKLFDQYMQGVIQQLPEVRTDVHSNANDDAGHSDSHRPGKR